MPNVEIEILKNGPYIVTGDITLKDHAGKEFTLEKKTIALCRCGASASKPFCDGMHSKVGFQAAEAAVPESAE